MNQKCFRLKANKNEGKNIFIRNILYVVTTLADFFFLCAIYFSIHNDTAMCHTATLLSAEAIGEFDNKKPSSESLSHRNENPITAINWCQ